jgi:uncharacterized protein
VIKAVLDVNVLISAAFPNDASPKRLLEAWDRGEFELVVSPVLIAELTRVLQRPRIVTRLRDGAGNDLLGAIAELAIHVADSKTASQPRSEDPDDDYLIALAMNQRAALVSGDRHLTDLRGTIPVYSPAEFLDYLAAS